MRPIREVVIHCAATPRGKWFDVDDIRKWHTLPPPKGRGWSDVGYHYIVLLDGTVQLGRPVEQVGAHVAGRNSGTIGVCYIGGVDDMTLQPADTRTQEQKAAMETLLRELLARFPTITLISGHRDYAPKACPSFDARAEYASLLKKAPR